jgi:hypothetical protein
MNPADGMPPRQPQGRPPLKPLRPPRQHALRRWLAVAGTVIAAAAIAVVTALPAHPAQRGLRAFDPGTGVRGLASLKGTPTGTQIDLALTGLPAGQRCTLVTVSPAGTAIAGTWTADNDGTAEITGATAIPLGQLTALRIETPSDRLLLSIPLLSRRGWPILNS